MSKKKVVKGNPGQEVGEVSDAVISIPDDTNSCSQEHITHRQNFPQTQVDTVNQATYTATRIDTSTISSETDTQTTTHPDSQFTNAEISAENVPQISPLMIKHLLSCISPLTVTDLNQYGLDQQGNRGKFSLENLLVPPVEGTSQPVVSTDILAGSFPDVQSQVEQADTPGHVQISATLLQNLLQGISHPIGNTKTDSQPNVTLPSIQQFTSQPLQALIQSLFPQENSTTAVSSSSQQVEKSTPGTAAAAPESTSVFSVDTRSSTSSSVQATDLLPSTQVNLPLAISPSNPSSPGGLQTVSTVQHSDQQQIFNNIFNAASQHQALKVDVPHSGFPADTPTSSQLVTSVPPTVGASLVKEGFMQVRGLPLLVQPTGTPGEPLQLIPLDRGVDLNALKDILQKITAQQSAPLSKCFMYVNNF